MSFGPVPFTLQTMALAMLPAILDRKGACAAVAVYLLLGAVGLPVFSGFGSGIGQIAGMTGGFLWGFLIGTIADAAYGIAAGLMSRATRKHLSAFP